jgi:hypothetical protein
VSDEVAFEMDYSTMPPSCFPVGMDRGELVNASRIGDAWARYINTRTGEEVDCAEYAEAAQRYAAGF